MGQGRRQLQTFMLRHLCSRIRPDSHQTSTQLICDKVPHIKNTAWPSGWETLSLFSHCIWAKEVSRWLQGGGQLTISVMPAVVTGPAWQSLLHAEHGRSHLKWCWRSLSVGHWFWDSCRETRVSHRQVWANTS